jgi:hypothetical protein
MEIVLRRCGHSMHVDLSCYHATFQSLLGEFAKAKRAVDRQAP